MYYTLTILACGRYYVAMKQPQKKAIVIGSGIGGLCTAARLLAAGYQVTVYEKEDQVGGRANRLVKQGYTFDMGPTLLMMIDVLEQTFADCGKDFYDYIELLQLEPNYRVSYADGSSLTVSSNIARFGRELSKISPEAPEQFYKFFAITARIYRLARARFIDRNFDRVTDFISPSAGYKLLRDGGLMKLYNFVSKYFSDERLRMLFSFQSMYLGVSPYAAPAVYSVVSYMESGLGIWYPKGGMYQLSIALRKLVEDLGGVVHCNTPVGRILVEGKQVRGVELADGTRVEADIVVSNADLAYTYQKLLQRHERPKFSDRRLNGLKQASSALLFYWGVKDPLDGLLHHNVVFSRDFRQNLDQIFYQGKLPTDPAFYLYIPTKTDPDLAPKGRNVCYVLVPVPNLQAKIDWEKGVEKIREKVLKGIKQRYGLDLRDSIEVESVFTPKDFETKYNLVDGSAFGLSHYFFQSGYFRPHNVVRGIKGVYLVGASTYPGSGVPMVTLGAKLVVERIMADAQTS